MFIARFALGLGIGPKSATVPIFASECAPASIRGALVMQWQVWTAFGIMVGESSIPPYFRLHANPFEGYAADLAFYSVPDTPNIQGLNWRLMMGSAMLPAVIVCCFVFLCPESPRWYISKGKHEKAWHAVQKLRFNKVQAARDLFYIQYLVDIEQREVTAGQNKVKEIFTVPRNRRAMQASEIVMFMQQFCGVNVIAYYSSEIFVGAGFSEISALGASMGFGVINFLFALPAFYTIDTFGRRNLLLTTFPLMALCMLFTGFSFWIPSDSQASLACIALGIYLFGVVYSPGEGPVPFTYSAEAYPLYIRAQGMSLATATTWFFNFILSLTWPSLLTAFKPQGAFGWYAGWNIVGFFGVLFFVPETKGKTLEELDAVFNIPSRLHAAWGAKSLVWFFQRHILRRNVAKPQLLPEHDDYDHRTFSQEEENNAEKRV
jgi:sugar porter (SP) family MFS transporter